jgi:predicted nucleic acid-binding protein
LSTFVLDCSVSASWCLQDETNEQAAAVLENLKKDKALVPCLWPIEMANVLVVAERRKRINHADATRALELLLSLPIVVEPGDEATVRALQETAREHNLSAYDASYLELARRAGLPLATVDQSLRTAAEKDGIPLIC